MKPQPPSGRPQGNGVSRRGRRRDHRRRRRGAGRRRPRRASPGAARRRPHRLKGVGPKFVARLNELGITRFDQLAGLNANEVAHLDERMGPFQGRLARDRVIEQADLLARGDTESFEEKFGKLTPSVIRRRPDPDAGLA